MKKLLFLLPILGVIVACFYTYSQFNLPNDKKEENQQSEGNNEDVGSTITPEDLISEILSLASEGKITEVPYRVGITELNLVNQDFGEPKSNDETTLRTYATYSNGITIGYQKSLIFDLRSYDENLQQIHLSDIKQVQGEPDETRYYKDDNVDQIILIYKLNSKYQLKWILSNPTEQEPDPVVHHISVYTEPPISADVLIKLINMTLDQKIGQMIFAGVDGTSYNQNADSLIHEFHVGGIIFNKKNFTSPIQTVQYINQIRAENAKNQIPLFLGVDQEGGIVAKLPGNLTPIPTNLEIGKKNNEQFSHAIGQILGKEVKAYGFNMNFAPVLDINSNPNNPVIGNRSFGNNADLVSRLGISTMNGLQSENVIAVVKHFPGHGDTATDSHLELPRVNKTLPELEQLELLPFQQAIHDGADVVMIAHILLPEIDVNNPSSMSEAIITDLLRGQLGYDGVVITDDMTMEAITDHYDISGAAVQSVKAGSDIIMIAHDFHKVTSAIEALRRAVVNGEITEDRIDESVIRILQLKEKYQLNNNQVQDVDVNAMNQQVQNVLNDYYY
ncbi:beta-N-acetylhexosaminidase [Ureibacillus sp. MALMAid1270]|uniref:beta-N-acetylhexosaminidase n=1 Tax=Ureibacillus sp. MALMAid1270 TaxID=3411629 RepID=UPI003BA6EAAF